MGDRVMWQDIILGVGGFGFAFGLLPSIFSKDRKPAKLSCLITGCILLAFCVVYASLGLWLGFIATGTTAAMWFMLMFQWRGDGDKAG